MAVERLVTAAELEQMRGGKHFELVRGRLVPVSPAGDRHGQVAVILAARLHDFVRKQRLGRVRVETGFYLSRDPEERRLIDEHGELNGEEVVPGFNYALSALFEELA